MPDLRRARRGGILWLLPRTPASPAVILIALCLPLIFRLVPKNRVYGLRTPGTLRATDETWYRRNAIAGMVVAAIGSAWLIVVSPR